MSELLDDLNDIVTDRLGGTADSVTNLRTGLQFLAELEAVSDIELNTTLGRDARESVLFHVPDRTVDLRHNDVLTVQLSGVGANFKVLRIKLNPVSPETEVGCMRVVSGKDSI